MAEVARLREQYTDTVFLAFPGNEVASGGCVLFDQAEAVRALIGECVLCPAPFSL